MKISSYSKIVNADASYELLSKIDDAICGLKAGKEVIQVLISSDQTQALIIYKMEVLN